MSRRKPSASQAVSEKNDHEVGYGKPPKQHQFKRGQSGNPKGRPKGSLNLSIEVRNLLNEQLEVRSKGRTQKVPAIIALIKVHLQKALGGDAAAFRTLLGLLDRVGELRPVEAATPIDQAEDKMGRLDLYLKHRFGLDSSALNPKEGA